MNEVTREQQPYQNGYAHQPFAKQGYQQQPYPNQQGYAQGQPYAQQTFFQPRNDSAQERQAYHEQSSLPMGGFKPLTKEEREEAARIKAQEGFSWAGYQVIHKELFSHKYDPTLTVKDSSITFNNACISRLDKVVYVQLLINPSQQKLVIRPCRQDARDAIRWCVEKGDKRKSRQITCRLFAAKLYELMGWETMYRYKMQGTRIDYQGEDLYVFDLTSTEVWLPQTKEVDENGKVKRKSRPPVYPASWRDSFGLPVDEHEKSTQIDLAADFNLEDVGTKTAESAENAGGEEVTEREVKTNV